MLSSQFCGCRQRVGELIAQFLLGLKELYCKLQRRDPMEASSEELLKEQMLLGMEDCHLACILKIFARRNQEVTFSELQQEA